MRDKSLRERVKSGEIILGMGILSENTDFVEITGHAGFDFLYLEREHCTTSWETLLRLVVAADAAGIPVIIRVEKNDPVLIERALDIGAQGILVPHVCSREDMLRAVQAAKFYPRGKRGAESIRAARFSIADFPGYMKRSNLETLVCAMIEDKEAVDNLDEILSVEGLDCVCFGPFDYSVSIGVPGELDHPSVKGAFARVIAKAKEREVAVWYSPIPATIEGVNELIAKGISVILLDLDRFVWQRRCGEVMESIVKRIKHGS